MRRIVAGLRARARSWLFRRAADREMDEEIRFHLEMETAKHLERGVPPAEARRRAHAAFGGVERHREKLRAGRRLPLFETTWQDLRFGARSARRTPGLSFVVVATVAIGIGATTTVFSAANAVLLRRLPLPEADELFSIQERRSGMVANGIEGMLLPYDRYQSYQARSDGVFTELAAHRIVEAFSLRLPDATVAVGGALTSANYFEALGVRPFLGRTYTSESAREIVISHDLWATRFEADPRAVGSAVRVDGRTVVVVGVAPPWFGGATLAANDLWAPIGLRGEDRTGWDSRVVPIGRLASGVSRQAAIAAVRALALDIPPEEHTVVRSARLDPLAIAPSGARGPIIGFFAMLQGMALLVLLIAVSNITGLMLARGMARRRELAVRLAIGAGRATVVRHLLCESSLLFGAGGVVGICAAYAGAGWLSGIELPPQAPEIVFDPSPDHTVLVFAVALTCASCILSGLLPALRGSGPDLAPALKAGNAPSSARESILHGGFVVAQVTLACTLLLMAMLFARSLQNGLRVDVGFQPEGVVAATVNLGEPLDYGRKRGFAFHRELLDRILGRPGVESAALIAGVPLAAGGVGGAVLRDDADDSETVPIEFTQVSEGYFETMGIEVVEGRSFDERDAETGPPVAVINEELAERLWPGESAVGRRMRGILGPDPVEVVGVTKTGRYSFVTEAPTPFAYQPFSQAYRRSMSLVVRAPGAEAATLRRIAEEVRRLDADVALSAPVRVSELVGMALLPHRFAGQLIGAFGIIGLVMVVVGIQGLLAYRVARRVREIGVRRTLGASAGRILRAVVGQAIVLAAAGCAIGLLMGVGLARTLRGFLFEVGPSDPMTLTAVPLTLCAAALIGSVPPALRALAIEASEALKAE